MIRTDMYEYKSEWFYPYIKGSNQHHDPIPWLNKQGQKGWQLVHVEDRTSNYMYAGIRFFFMRQVP